MKCKLLIFIVMFYLLMFVGLFAQQVRLGVLWYPQAQFAGYIMAAEKGFFAEEGLEVQLVYANGVVSYLESLLSGDLDYTLAWLAQAVSVNQKEELVMLGQFFQSSNYLLVGLKERGIYAIEDFNGRNINSWGGQWSLPFDIFLRKHNLTVNQIAGNDGVALLMGGACDAITAMSYNLYYSIYLRGVEFDEMTVVKFADDPDLNFLEDGLYTTRSRWERDPAESAKIMRAIKRGWEYAYHNQEETIEVVVRNSVEYKMVTSTILQRWMLRDCIEALFEGSTIERYNFDQIGVLEEGDYKLVTDVLLREGVITRVVPFNRFYVGAGNE